MTLAVKKQKILKRQKPCISVSRSFKKSEPKFEKLRLFGFRCGMGLTLPAGLIRATIRAKK